MCLTSISKKPKPRPGIGVKRFLVWDGHLFGSHFGRKRRPVGKWLDAEDFRRRNAGATIYTNSFSGKYPNGWHIWKTIPYSNTSLRYVQFRGVLCHGHQGRRHVIIARYIKILPKTYKPVKRRK